MSSLSVAFHNIVWLTISTQKMMLQNHPPLILCILRPCNLFRPHTQLSSPVNRLIGGVSTLWDVPAMTESCVVLGRGGGVHCVNGIYLSFLLFLLLLGRPNQRLSPETKAMMAVCQTAKVKWEEFCYFIYFRFLYTWLFCLPRYKQPFVWIQWSILLFRLLSVISSSL